MKVAIIGYGFVGKKMAEFFGKAHAVCAYDPPLGLTNRIGVNGADLAVVCVPTPSMEDGSCDVSVVEETVRWIEAPIILIRSTVSPGTTAKLAAETGKSLAFCPEYLGEGAGAFQHEEDVGWWIVSDTDDGAFRVCARAIEQVVPGATVYGADSYVAEAVKYFENEYLAWQVIFAAEMYEACAALGVAYEDVRRLWTLDPRVNRTHTTAHSGDLGFGGKCLPKDTLAWARRLEQAGYRKRVLEAVLRKNGDLRRARA